MKKGLYRKGLVIGLILLFVGAGVIPSTVGIMKEKATIQKIGSGGYIQDLIDNASDGDTIYIPSGIYNETIIIDKSINLIGEDKNTTIIDGNGYEDVINVSADGVNISGFTIQHGIHGLFIASNNNIINGNIICNRSANYTSVKGIILLGAYNIITGNTICKHGGRYGHVIGVWGFNNTITGNTIFYNPEGIYIRGLNNTITGNTIFDHTWQSILIHLSSNNTVTNNNITNSHHNGIHVEKSFNNYIICNNISSNTLNGIYFQESYNNIVTGNNISNNNEGLVFFYNSYNNTITGNNIFDNLYNGINLGTGSNTITNNLILNNFKGIYLSDSKFNLITRNNISLSNTDGIYLTYNSVNNTIKSNNISKNFNGIYLELDSLDNIIYHNNFIENEQNAYDECNNSWDDGKYGNFWSDYKEKYPDAKPKILKPWMWDTPYEINGGDNKDNCPLIKQWPDSRSGTITRINTIIHPILQWLLERFPLLERLLNIIYLKINII
jgi:parallel beta-helix repeat protein